MFYLKKNNNINYMTEKIKKDIIMLVIASKNNIYNQFINEYWCHFINYVKTNHNDKIKIYLIFGNNVETSDLNLKDDDKLILNCEESFKPGILKKTIESFKIINDLYEYKHILRTNLSSFFIIENLIKLSDRIKDNNIFAGVIYNHKFINGAGMWFSKDIINILLQNENELDFKIIDDVSIGHLLLAKKKIKATALPRYTLFDKKVFKGLKPEEVLKKILKENHYHVRIKHDKDRNNDIKYMKGLTKLLYNK